VTTLILDSGGVSALANQRARLAELRRRGLWPAQVPSVVLAEALTGDHRRDVAENRLLKACQIRNVTELLAREAARLRAATGRAGTIAATDAIVVAFAATCSAPVILTSDSRDLGALAAHAERSIHILPT
jgi:predicted nucleic acid-binding protein